jgi:HSP20 family protein
MANIVRKSEPSRALMTPRAAEWEPFRMVRDLLRWDPFAELSGFTTPMERGVFTPYFEVKETPGEYFFKADLPGVYEKDLEIALTGNRLTISGKREAEEQTESDTYYVYERSYGTFTRTFTLPEGVDADKVKADLKNGVLSLVVPKKPEAQPKKISVKGLSEKETAKA